VGSTPGQGIKVSKTAFNNFFPVVLSPSIIIWHHVNTTKLTTDCGIGLVTLDHHFHHPPISPVLLSTQTSRKIHFFYLFKKNYFSHKILRLYYWSPSIFENCTPPNCLHGLSPDSYSTFFSVFSFSLHF